MAAGAEWLYTVVPEPDGAQATVRSARNAMLFRRERVRIRQVLVACCLGAAISVACLLTFAPDWWDRGTLQNWARRSGLESVVVLDQEEVVTGNGSIDGCPYFAVRLTKAECEAMPKQFGGRVHRPFVVENAEDPRGCFSFLGDYYYNRHEIGGSKRDGRKVFCRRSGVSLRFQKITRGVCVDYGYLPIISQATCEAAAREMGLANPSVKITALKGRPEGCYYFKNFVDGTATLWLSTNVQNEGVGEQESDTPGEFTRQPVCMGQTTTMPAATTLRTTTSSALPTTTTMAVTATRTTPLSRTPKSSELPLTTKMATTAAATTASAVGPCEFLEGKEPSNACPPGSVPLNETECRSLPAVFGHTLHRPFIIESGEDPRGCFLFSDWYYYNTHPNGKGRFGRKLYCKHC